MNEKAVNVTMSEYEAFIATTWMRDDNPLVNEIRMWNGLQGETGEMAEVNKKWHRDGGDPDVYRERMTKEIGDALYYLATIANFNDITMDEAMRANVDKLSSRKVRGLLHGSGDDR